MFATIRSVYRWEGRLERAVETPMTLKTTAEAAPALVAFLAERHPYDTPCILTWRTEPELSHPDYLAWVADEVAPPDPKGE